VIRDSESCTELEAEIFDCSPSSWAAARREDNDLFY
jgi:hypothetical protein